MRGIASELRAGHSIIRRNEKGQMVGKPLPISSVVWNPPGCRQHVHVQLKDGPKWCYDSGAPVEMT